MDIHIKEINPIGTVKILMLKGEQGEAGVPTQEMTDSAVAAWLDDHPEATTTVQDGSITEAKLESTLLAKINTGGMTDDAKVALLALLEKVAFANDEDGRDYLDALEAALYPDATLLSISAVFTQGQAIISDTDDLNTLKQYLVVTGYYDDGTYKTVTAYTLSGTLTTGTSTITVSYGGKTTTFNVTVTHDTTAQLTNTDAILAKDDNYTNSERIVSRTNGGVTIYYPMDTPTNILFPAGIIPTATTSIFTTQPKPSVMLFDSNKNFLTNGFVNEENRWAQSASGTMTEFSNSWTLAAGNYYYIRFSIDIRYIDDAYMYDKTTGQVWFAGKNTPYFGMSNISEAGGE